MEFTYREMLELEDELDELLRYAQEAEQIRRGWEKVLAPPTEDKPNWKREGF